MRIQTSWTRLLPWMAVFAIAMAFLESAVVIYLRELYYPVEFKFPMAPIAQHVAITELLRELATMVMLLAPAALITTRRLERFGWFCFCFGIWDIFYYLFLKAILDWPATLLDWDILFLVPVVWVGPVLAPCIVSFGLITLGCILLHRLRHDRSFAPALYHWAALATSGVLILYTFIEEPLRHILAAGESASPLPRAGHMALDQLRAYLPEHYSWGIFLMACGIATLALLHLSRRKA